MPNIYLAGSGVCRCEVPSTRTESQASDTAGVPLKNLHGLVNRIYVNQDDLRRLVLSKSEGTPVGAESDRRELPSASPQFFSSGSIQKLEPSAPLRDGEQAPIRAKGAI